MALFDPHINQARKNLTTLEQVNGKVSDCVDWQVTIGFYSALHFVNAYLAREANIHYNTHHQVDTIINCEGVSPHKLSREVYLAYEKLKNLARRSRYMIHDDETKRNNEHAFLTTEKHLYKAIKNLDIVISFFNQKYRLSIPKIKLTCTHFSASDKFNHIETPSVVKS